MVSVYEIQASFVGIGKSTFARKFELPFADDCVHLVNSLSDYWYSGSRFFLSPEVKTESLFKAFLVLENSACAVSEALSKNRGNVVVSSRSALVSAVQFLPFLPSPEEIKALADYYEARLKYNGVDRVIILDFGSSILNSDHYVACGYDRMRKRARPYEINHFNTFEKYKSFFQQAEWKKDPMVKELKERSHMFHYKNLEFLDFDKENYKQVSDIMATFETISKFNKEKL